MNKLVVLLLGDEWCRVPRYSSRVLAVFKCYGFRPTLKLNYTSSYLSALIILQHFRIMFKSFRRVGFKKNNVFPFPLGYFRQSDLPVIPILERIYDVSFVGSVRNSSNQKHARYFDFLKSPKTLSRQAMVKSLDKWENCNRYKTDIHLTSQFPNADKPPEVPNYSEKLMNTKICLSPRGTSLETFRYFEALRYGCVLISEPIPSHSFYRDSPAIYLNNWDKLPYLLNSLLENPGQLADLHRKALEWWETQCSPNIVSQRMYQSLSFL